MTMGDRVAVLDHGLLQQCAAPKDLFTDPVNLFVAGFIGSPQMNLLAAKAGDDGAAYGSLVVPLTPDQRAALTSDAVTIGVRPEDWRVEDDGGIEVVVAVVEELGSEAFLYCTDPTADVVTAHPLVARAEGLSASQPGDRIHLVPRLDRVHLFDTVTGARL
jgi:multiple sugar transport system ATP-binding protein